MQEATRKSPRIKTSAGVTLIGWQYNVAFDIAERTGNSLADVWRRALDLLCREELGAELASFDPDLQPAYKAQKARARAAAKPDALAKAARATAEAEEQPPLAAGELAQFRKLVALLGSKL